MSKIINVKIEMTHLYYQDHGILTAELWFSGSYVFGGLRLDTPNPDIGNPSCGLFIGKVLTVLGMQSEGWEHLVGSYCRIRVAEDKHLEARIEALGNLIKEQWLTLDDIMKKGSA